MNLVIDVLLLASDRVGLWGSLFRACMKLRTGGWPMTDATVVNKRRSGRADTVDLGYTYVVGGERYGGSYRRRFADEGTAERYLKSFDYTPRRYVRYHPRDPRRSWLIE